MTLRSGDRPGVGRITEKELIENVGRRIAELREDSDLTQQQLADRLGVSPQYLRRAESGSANLSLRSLHRFAACLDVEVVELFATPLRLGKRNPGRPPKKPQAGEN